ncbi:unnamed protein product [Caretta caretta]
MVMFTSDGASMMLGKLNGVVAQLKRDIPHLVQQHCAAHQSDLGISDAWKEVKLIRDIKTLMRTVCTVFCRSSRRKCKFQEIVDASECTKRKAYSSPRGQLAPISEDEERPRKTRSLASVRDMDETALRKDIGSRFPALHSMEEADGRRTMELEVRQLCSNTLQSLGDSPRMANVLWPGLLLQLSPAAYGLALPLLLQTSVRVVKRMQEEGRLPLARRVSVKPQGHSTTGAAGSAAGDPPRQGPGSAAEPRHQHALLAISYLGKFKPRLSKEQEAETISPCIASAMIQRPALAKLSGTEVARSSAIRAEDLKPMAEQGYMARLLTSQAFNVQRATRYWASQAVYWLFTPCKAIVYTQTGVVATVLSKTQKDASCRESPAHVPKLIAKHLPSRDLMPFSFTLLEKGECADQLAGIMEAVLRERESELQGQTTRSLWELVGALGQADTLDGLEDDLFASCFLAIACSLARHLSGAQQDLSSDASPHSMAVQALARVLHLRGSQPAVELTDQERGWQLLEEAQPEGFALLSR